MKHLHDATALKAAEGTLPSAVQDHVHSCARCRSVIADYERLLSGLSAVAQQAPPPEGVVRWARAFARTAGQRPTLTTRVLELVARGAAPAHATRGVGQPGAALLFADGDHQLDVRLQPTTTGGLAVRGQVVPLGDIVEERWQIEVITDQGSTFRADSDASGEFALEIEGDPRRLSVTATGEGRLLVAPSVPAREGESTA